MQDAGRPNHSAHCCRQGGAVDPDGDKWGPYVYPLEEAVVLNQQSPGAEDGRQRVNVVTAVLRDGAKLLQETITTCRRWR